MALFTVIKIKGVAYKYGDVDGKCKQSLKREPDIFRHCFAFFVTVVGISTMLLRNNLHQSKHKTDDVKCT